jgi:hypothetical protein
MILLPSVWPVVIGAVSSTVIAIGWYGVFGSPQTNAASGGSTDEKLGAENIWAGLFSSFASYLLMAFAVGILVLRLDIQHVQGVLMFSAVASVGYVVLNTVTGRLSWINAGLMILLLTMDALLVYAFDIM